MAARGKRWIWIGRAVFAALVLAVASYLSWVGLDRADKVASSVGLIVALLALGAPRLLPPESSQPAAALKVGVERTGEARAESEGIANTGLRILGAQLPSGSIVVSTTGNITARNGGHANSGVEYRTQ